MVEQTEAVEVQPSLEELARDLHQKRQDTAQARDAWAAAVDEWEGTPAATLLRTEAIETAVALDSADKALREAALEAYSSTGEIHLSPGVEVKMVSKLRYDPVEAFAWAKKHDIALALDPRAFAAIAKSQTIDCVHFDEVPTVNLASDFGKVLGDG